MTIIYFKRHDQNFTSNKRHSIIREEITSEEAINRVKEIVENAHSYYDNYEYQIRDTVTGKIIKGKVNDLINK